MYVYDISQEQCICMCVYSPVNTMKHALARWRWRRSRRSRIQATILSKFSNSIQSIQEQLSNHLSISYSNRHSFIYNHILYIYIISIYLSIYFTYVCTKTQLSSAVRRDASCPDPSSALETVPEEPNLSI